jgi:hypothetical protein
MRSSLDHRRLVRLACAGALATAPWVAAPAAASGFAADGTYSFDADAVYAEGFESFTPAADAGPGDLQVVDRSDALEGSKVAKLQSQYSSVDVPVKLPSKLAAYRASVWVRGRGFAGVMMGYDDGAPGQLAQMFPTGRMTSDGWVELACEPFTVDGPRGATVVVFLFGSLEADAIEVKAAPEAVLAVPRRCAGVADTSCSGDALCFGGWCHPTSGWVPPPPSGKGRETLLRYLENRLRFFFGPYRNRKTYLPSALVELQSAGPAGSAWRFWNSFATAVRRLQDWHSSTFGLHDFVLENRKPLNVCFVEGDGDLTHASAPSDPAYPDVLVSHAGPDHTWGLKAGDRLVAIDGKHPIAWMRSLVGLDWGYHASDDPTTLSDFTERMRSSIPRFARTMTVVRCSGASCGAAGVVDVTAVAEVPPDTEVDVVACDHRPSYLVAGAPSNHDVGGSVIAGPVVSTQPEERIYGAIWDSLMGGGSSTQQQLDAAVAEWRAKSARAVILDHRTGNGGTIDSFESLVGFVRTKKLFGADLWRSRADDEGPKDTAEGLALLAKYEKSSEAWWAGGDSPATDVPVALLITRDGSASDYFPYAMKGAPKVRIFGPHATVGAFSSYMGLGYWMAVNYQLAAGDTIGYEGIALTGHGVRPDEVVAPKQSDLVAGKDTIAQRALAWVRAEAKP